MKPFVAGLIAIAAMILSLELLAAATGDDRREAGIALTGSLHEFPGISYPEEWYPE